MDVSEYLKKFKNAKLPETELKDAVIAAFKAVLKYDLDRNVVSYSSKQGIVKIQGNSALKSEIVMKQNKLIEKVKEINSNLKIAKIV